MGIPLDPPDDKGLDCGMLFPAGQTPDTMYASFGGIALGDDWIPGLPGTPNGVWALPQVLACKWEFENPTWKITYEPGNPFGIVLEAELKPGVLYFFNQNPIFPPYRFVNENIWPQFNIYYGGSAQIMFIADPPDASFQEIADLVSVPKESDTMVEFWPYNAQDVMVRFANQRYSINVLTKIEL